MLKESKIKTENDHSTTDAAAWPFDCFSEWAPSRSNTCALTSIRTTFTCKLKSLHSNMHPHSGVHPLKLILKTQTNRSKTPCTATSTRSAAPLRESLTIGFLETPAALDSE